MQAARPRRLVADDGSAPPCPCRNPPSSLIRRDLTEIGRLLAQLGPKTRAQDDPRTAITRLIADIGAHLDAIA